VSNKHCSIGKASITAQKRFYGTSTQVFIIMNPIDLNLEPPILAVSMFFGAAMIGSRRSTECRGAFFLISLA
jgi:hypothetical protein